MKRGSLHLLLFSILLLLSINSCDDPPASPDSDKDRDGVVDLNDECPDVAGSPQFNGCPDTDGDGVPDESDQCPTTFGSPAYYGCPPPDSDGDGISDNEDNCPNDPGDGGVYNGCPWWRVDICSGQSIFNYSTINGNILRWQNKEATFYMGSNVPSSWRDIIFNGGMGPWHWAGSKFRYHIYGSGNPIQYDIVPGDYNQDGKNIISYGPLNNSQAIGETHFWYNPSTGYIAEADIRLNSAAPLAIGDLPGYFDVQSVSAHEFGHVPGLDHVDDKTQTMYPYIHDNSIIMRTLCDGDIAGIRFLYP